MNAFQGNYRFIFSSSPRIMLPVGVWSRAGRGIQSAFNFLPCSLEMSAAGTQVKQRWPRFHGQLLSGKLSPFPFRRCHSFMQNVIHPIEVSAIPVRNHLLNIPKTEKYRNEVIGTHFLKDLCIFLESALIAGKGRGRGRLHAQDRARYWA